MLRKYTVHGHVLVPASIDVEAESKEEAKEIARQAEPYQWDAETSIEEVDCIDDVEDPLCEREGCYSYALPDQLRCEECETQTA